MSAATWVWPSNEEINDFPDPLGFEDEWDEWRADMADDPRACQITAREHLQNSWDSIQEQLFNLLAAHTDPPERHGVDYRFVRLTGDEAVAFVSQFGLDRRVFRRLTGMSDQHRRDNRLAESRVAAGKTDAIELLVASETCGQGMGGPWRTGGKAGVVSRSQAAADADPVRQGEPSRRRELGPWQEGHRQCISVQDDRRLHALRTRRPDQRPERPRRFLGVSYWRSHDLGDRAHVGLGLFGRSSAGGGSSFAESFEPLGDSDADELVRDLAIPGLEDRSPDDASHLGTTYLIVEPSFEPSQLAAALERSWWPLLERGSQA